MKTELSDPLNDLKERLNHSEFLNYKSQFAGQLTDIKTRVRDTVLAMQSEQGNRIKEAEQDLIRIAEWQYLNQQEQNTLLADLEKLTITAEEDLSGLQMLINQEFNIHSELQDMKTRVQQKGQQLLQEKLREEQEAAKQAEGTATPAKITRSLQPKKRITSLEELSLLINELQRLKGELALVHEFELEISLSE